MTAESKPQTLAERLRAAAKGRVEWRVQDPVEKCYCMVSDFRSSLDPERQARDWLKDHIAHFPSGRYAGYEVARHVVLDAEDRLLIEAAEALESLAALHGAAYQALGAVDAPVEMLDNLSAAASGLPLPHLPTAGLPWSSDASPKQLPCPLCGGEAIDKQEQLAAFNLVPARGR